MILKLWFTVFLLAGVLAGIASSFAIFTPEKKIWLILAKISWTVFFLMIVVGLSAIFALMWFA